MFNNFTLSCHNYTTIHLAWASISLNFATQWCLNHEISPLVLELNCSLNHSHSPHYCCLWVESTEMAENQEEYGGECSVVTDRNRDEFNAAEFTGFRTVKNPHKPLSPCTILHEHIIRYTLAMLLWKTSPNDLPTHKISYSRDPKQCSKRIEHQRDKGSTFNSTEIITAILTVGYRLTISQQPLKHFLLCFMVWGTWFLVKFCSY